MKRQLITLIIFCFTLISLAQEKTKKVGLFWDTSYSMIEKDLQKEIQFLAGYFKENPNIRVHLTKFSNDIIFERTYAIENGNWEEIKTELIGTVYDGSSSYGNIQMGENDEILLFTDGKESLDKLPQYFTKTTQIISSSSDAAKELLKNIAAYSNGNFFDLSATSANDDSSKPIKVSGVVSDIVGGLSGAKVFSRETKKEAITDVNGAYTIEAMSGGVLEFRASGKNTLFVRVSDFGGEQCHPKRWQ